MKMVENRLLDWGDEEKEHKKYKNQKNGKHSG